MCECVYWLLCPLIKLCFTLVNGNSTELNVNWRGYSHRQALGHTHTLTRIKFLTNMLSNKYLGSTPILFKNETFYKFPKPLYFCLCSDTAKRRKEKQSLSLSRPVPGCVALWQFAHQCQKSRAQLWKENGVIRTVAAHHQI